MKYQQFVNDAQQFVKEIAIELGDAGDTAHAERVMTSVFHSIRDILSPEESLHLISQLPMLLKAVYVNEWHLSKKQRIRTMDEFIENLMLQSPRTVPKDFGNDEKVKQKTKAVLRVLRRHLAIGEVKDIVDQFPGELSELWLSEEEVKERVS